MSYILDALRRADAERDRGTVPGLHSQPMPLAAEPPAPRRPVPSWAWIAVGGAVGVAGLVLWHSLAGDAEPAPTPAPPRVATPAPTAADTRTPSPPEVVPPSEAAALPDQAPLPVARQPQSSRSVAAPTPRAAPVDETPARHAETPAVESSTRAAAPSGAPTARQGDAAREPRAEASAIRHEQLPEDVKRNLPPLAVGGSMYSPEPSQRMLILNGQVTREGDTVGPDLVLESIRLRSAVLRYKEQRFEIAY